MFYGIWWVQWTFWCEAILIFVPQNISTNNYYLFSESSLKRKLFEMMRYGQKAIIRWTRIYRIIFIIEQIGIHTVQKQEIVGKKTIHTKTALNGLNIFFASKREIVVLHSKIYSDKKNNITLPRFWLEHWTLNAIYEAFLWVYNGQDIKAFRSWEDFQ